MIVTISQKEGIMIDILWEDVAFAIISDLIVKLKFTNEKCTAWFMQDGISLLNCIGARNVNYGKTCLQWRSRRSLCGVW